VVPASGNMAVAGQQIWFGRVHAGRPVTLWIDTRRVHILMNGQRYKTLPSKISGRELRALLAAGTARAAARTRQASAGRASPPRRSRLSAPSTRSGTSGSAGCA